MTKILDLKREHRMIGPVDDRGHSWAVQDGIIMGWSESNVRFEEAWWLTPEGNVVNHPSINKGHVDALVKERPFDPEWLK